MIGLHMFLQWGSAVNQIKDPLDSLIYVVRNSYKTLQNSTPSYNSIQQKRVWRHAGKSFPGCSSSPHCPAWRRSTSLPAAADQGLGCRGVLCTASVDKGFIWARVGCSFKAASEASNP